MLWAQRESRWWLGQPFDMQSTSAPHSAILKICCNQQLEDILLSLDSAPHHHSHNYGNRRKLITVTTQYKTLSKVRSCVTSEPYLPTALSFRWTITVMNWRNIGGHRKTQGVKGWLTPFLSFQPTCGETLLLSNWCVLIYVILRRAWLLWIILTLVAERHKV